MHTILALQNPTNTHPHTHTHAHSYKHYYYHPHTHTHAHSYKHYYYHPPTHTLIQTLLLSGKRTHTLHRETQTGRRIRLSVIKTLRQDAKLINILRLVAFHSRLPAFKLTPATHPQQKRNVLRIQKTFYDQLTINKYKIKNKMFLLSF